MLNYQHWIFQIHVHVYGNKIKTLYHFSNRIICAWKLVQLIFRIKKLMKSIYMKVLTGKSTYIFCFKRS